MIIRNLSLQGFGRFADPVEVGPLSDGVNLLFAPNGTGKSTLVRALGYAMMDSYSGKSAELQAWKPWGRGLTPRITVEFEHRGVAYRLEKQFLSSARSLLLRKEGGAWRQFAQNDAADDFVRKDVLNCTPPGSGVAKRDKHWGLAQVLWTTQGDLSLPALSGDVVESIQRSIGAALTAGGSKIEANLADLYNGFFTPKTGRLKAGAPAKDLEARLLRVDTELSAAEAELAEYERKSGEIASLEQRVAAASDQRLEVEGQRDDAKERAARYTALKGEVVVQQQAAKIREAAWLAARKRIDEIAEARRVAEQARVEAPAADAKVRELAAERDVREKACYRLKEEHGAARRNRNEAQAALNAAQASGEYLAKLDQCGAAMHAIEQLADIDRELAELSAKKSLCHAPTAKELAAVRELTAAERDHVTRLDAARVIAEIAPIDEVVIRVVEGEAAGEVAVRGGETASVPGSPNLTLEIPSFGSIRVRGPVTNYAEARAALDACRAKLGDYETRYGTRDVERLEAMRAGLEAINADAAVLQAKRKAVLGKQDVAKLKATQDEFARRIAELEQAHPEWRDSRPNPDQLRAAATHQFEAANARLEAAESECERAARDLNVTEAQLAAWNEKLNAARTTLSAAEERLAKLTAGPETDADRAAALDSAALEYHAAKAVRDKAEAALKELGDDPSTRVSLLERRLTQLTGDIEKLKESLVRTRTEATMLIDKSPHERVVALSEEQARVGAELERERRRMAAIELLKRVMDETKADLMNSIAGPIEAAANAKLAVICPQPVATLRMSSTFGMTGVQPAVEPSTAVPIAQLSGGEQEQLYLATRLALAEELAKSERQLLVLDDVLTFTDDDRLARICNLLTRASEKLQILILTCHPERFLGITSAKAFDLESLVNAHAPV